MSIISIEVPIQPYAGQLLIISDLILPDSASQDANKTKVSTKRKQRASFFDSSSIHKKIIKQLSQGNQADDISMSEKESLLDAFLAALETYMKHVVKKTIDLCEHRTSYHLYNDARCVMKNDMRTTMMFLNDLEMADYGSSDDDAGFYRKRRAENDDKERKVARLESVNDTAMLAIGGRKRPAEAPGPEAAPSGSKGGQVTGPPVQRPFALRFKHLNIRDVLQFMEEDSRYARSNMLFEAYLKYKS
ncbi:transcription initiation factor TFIID subunit 4 [Drosophila santomea]|uniref:transcription initiation factor TFIID subunit 4 n=1 Tax=Drosophila santomea TaxID=129105 RepID=UPI001953D484|nr:transcription initiation factor TFIID subunit 4 [Drosophila santomea]